MKIAADICVYTNHNIVIETLRKRMTDLTPREIVSELDKFIIGKIQLKRQCDCSRSRWRRKKVKSPLREKYFQKYFMIDQQVLENRNFSSSFKLASAPFLKVEATKFTEVGYVGRDVDQIVRDLIDSSSNDKR